MKMLLDTSVYSQPIKMHPLPSVIARWKFQPEREYAVSSICELEVFYGIELSGSEKLRLAYQKILKNRFPVLPFDERCAFRYAALQADFVKRGQTRPAFDLMIAATALVHGLTLATCNVADFKEVPDLKLEDWSDYPTGH